MDNKICVYAICKNESHFVERWLSSMEEADYIVVLDTGSDDNTYELLKNDKRVTKVDQKIINPWRFDVARNESMKLIPKDANILVCTDLDEILQPGWADILRKTWIEGETTRCNYKYIWSHNEEGEPGRIFVYDKITDRNRYWKFPVHETLFQIEERQENIIDLFDDITLEHFPDKEKSRASYLELLRQRAEENPEDYYGLYYLSQEYSYRGYYYESIHLLEKLQKDYAKYFTKTELAAIFLFKGDDYRALGKPQDAIYNYNIAIMEDPTYREPYLCAAEICNELKLYNQAIGYVKDCLKNAIRHYCWIERDNSWRDSLYDILSISYFYLGDIDKSLLNINKALELNKTSQRLLSNKEIILKAKKGEINE